MTLSSSASQPYPANSRSVSWDWRAPSASHRLAPFFILNEDLETPLSRARIRTMLEQFRDLGYGGAYLHPRLGMVTEYKSEAWFEAISYCREEAERLGLLTYLYDENTYPSGFAGGHVPALHPEARVRYVAWEILRGLPNALNHFTTTIDASDLFLAAWHLESEEPLRLGTRLDAEELAVWTQDQHRAAMGKIRPEGAIVAFFLREMKGSPWHGEFPYVSLADPVVAKAFLESTHEEYLRRMGQHFGKSIPAIFTDEPSLLTQNAGAGAATLHLTPYILAEFQRRRGYDLKENLAALFFDHGDYQAVRFDYYETLHALWLENWALPLERWCGKNGIALTGHYLEHDWPAPYSTPGHVHLLAHMHWPGIDLLYANGLAGEPAPWFSLQKSAPVAGKEPHLALLVHQCASVARQLGREKVLCEAWGAGGHASRPADYKRLGDWLVVLGINHLVPHHSMMTLRGARKADHPQFFSDQSSWFPQLRPLNDHLARLCQAMSRGHDERHILVLDPLTSGYLTARRASPLEQTHSGLCNEFSNFVQELADQFLAFDLGDEYVLEEFGRPEAGGLRVEHQHYRAIVLPAPMKNLRSATVTRLREHLSAGGQVWDLMAETPAIDGRPSEAWTELAVQFPRQVHRCASEAVAFLCQHFPPSARIDAPWEGGFAHARRIDPDGEIHLFVYSGAESGPVTVRMKAKAIRILNTLTGQEEDPEAEPDGQGFLHFTWAVNGPQSLLLTVRQESNFDPAPAWIVEPDESPALSLDLKRIRRESPNRLVLDFCDLHLPGRNVMPDQRVSVAQKAIFQHHGFLRNPWHRAIQYRRQIVERNTFAEGSGFRAVFRFEVRGALQNVRAAIEASDLYRIRLNGKELPEKTAPSEIDPWMREFLLPELREGWNELELEAGPFDVRMELDAVVLVGDFAVTPTARGFALTPPSFLDYGPWKTFGLPFYDRSICYHFPLPSLPEDCEAIWFDMEAACSLAEILIDGKPAGQWGLVNGPVRLALPSSDASELTVRLVGSPHNLFGAFHDPHPQRGICGNLLVGPKQGPVAGKLYRFEKTGLLAPPTIQAISQSSRNRVHESDSRRLTESAPQ